MPPVEQNKRRRVIYYPGIKDDSGSSSTRVSPVASSSRQVSSNSNANNVTATRSSPHRNSAAAAADVAVPEYGEIPALLLVEMQKDNCVDVCKAVEALSDLISVDEDNEARYKKNRADATRFGAIAIILVLMTKRWPKNEKLQISCSFFLAEFSFENTNDFTNTLVELGGIEAIVNALRAFPSPSCWMVQCNCCSALANLSQNWETSAAERFVNDLEGIALVVNVMRSTCRDEANAFANACELFSNLAAKKAEFRTKLTAAGALGIMATALEKHSDNPEVKKYAHQMMKNMSKWKAQ